jgi:DNA-binding NarL/FixJ family response regulator
MIKDVESSVERANGSMPVASGPVWVKGATTVASARLQKALGSRTCCHRGEAPPEGACPSAVVVCHPEDGPGATLEELASEVRGVLKVSPDAAVVVLCPSPDAGMARAAVGAGARGFVHAGMPPEQIVRAVSVAAEGKELALPRGLLEGLVAEGRGPDLSALSPRQREVSELVAEGLSNAEIARALYVAESTVKQHLRRAYRALGVNNRREATAALRRSGIPRV